MASGLDDTVGDKDRPDGSPATRMPEAAGERPVGRLPYFPGTGGGAINMNGSSKGAKRLKKSGNLPMYDNYRMVRPPAAAWDKKTHYEAIGRRRGVNFDDIFVVSSLFHHVSFLRVRVPDRLLDILGGAPDDNSTPDRPSWGLLEVRRSRWYDLFQIDDRVAGMQVAWSMMAYLMRRVEGEIDERKEAQDDARMTSV
jgi:hypothetical protein